MNYYQHNIGDFASETSCLSLEGVGIYIRLLDRYASTENPIETQWVNLAFQKEARGLADEILKTFFIEKDGGFVHSEMEKKIFEYQKNAEKNRVNGKRGGRPRTHENTSKNKEIESKNKETENKTETQSKPSGFPFKPNGLDNETQSEPSGFTTSKPITSKPITNKKENTKENSEASSTTSHELNLDCKPPAPREGDVFPFDSIVEKWNSICTTLPKVSALSQKRKESLKASDEQMKEIWKDGTTLQNFERLFKLVMSSNFLSGRSPIKSEGHQNFRCNFDWVINPNNVLKIVEGNYDNARSSDDDNPFLVRNVNRINSARELDPKKARLANAEEEVPAWFNSIVGAMR